MRYEIVLRSLLKRRPVVIEADRLSLTSLSLKLKKENRVVFEAPTDEVVYVKEVTDE